jgi:hypothetical protein
MGRLAACLIVIAVLALLEGCGLAPRNFRKITHPAPLVRARAMSLGRGQPDSAVLPALVKGLGDNDPVVRLAAHEELKSRTGRDFGYQPWGTTDERTSAMSRWRAWLTGRPAATRAAPAGPGKNLPRASSQSP